MNRIQRCYSLLADWTGLRDWVTTLDARTESSAIARWRNGGKSASGCDALLAALTACDEGRLGEAAVMMQTSTVIDLVLKSDATSLVQAVGGTVLASFLLGKESQIGSTEPQTGGSTDANLKLKFVTKGRQMFQHALREGRSPATSALLQLQCISSLCIAPPTTEESPIGRIQTGTNLQLHGSHATTACDLGAWQMVARCRNMLFTSSLDRLSACLITVTARPVHAWTSTVNST